MSIIRVMMIQKYFNEQTKKVSFFLIFSFILLIRMTSSEKVESMPYFGTHYLQFYHIKDNNQKPFTRQPEKYTLQRALKQTYTNVKYVDILLSSFDMNFSPNNLFSFDINVTNKAFSMSRVMLNFYIFGNNQCFQIGFTVIVVCQPFSQVYYSFTAYLGQNDIDNDQLHHYDPNYTVPNQIVKKGYAISFNQKNYNYYQGVNYANLYLSIEKNSTNNNTISILLYPYNFNRIRLLIIILNNTALSETNSEFSQLTIYQFEHATIINCRLQHCRHQAGWQLYNPQKMGKDIRRQCILKSRSFYYYWYYWNYWQYLNQTRPINNFNLNQNGIEIPIYNYEIKKQFTQYLYIYGLCFINLKCPDTHPFRYNNSRFCGNCERGTIVQGNNSLPGCLVEDENFIQFKYFPNNSVQLKCGRCVVSSIQQSTGISLAFIITGPLIILLMVLANHLFTKKFQNSNTIKNKKIMKINKRQYEQTRIL